MWDALGQLSCTRCLYMSNHIELLASSQWRSGDLSAHQSGPWDFVLPVSWTCPSEQDTGAESGDELGDGLGDRLDQAYLPAVSCRAAAAVEGFVYLPPLQTSSNGWVSLDGSWSLHRDTQSLAASHRACLVGWPAACSVLVNVPEQFLV